MQVRNPFSPAERRSRPCICGHSWDAHQHYRAGRECSLCPPGICGRYRPRFLPLPPPASEA
jgi:hypothetical protein